LSIPPPTHKNPRRFLRNSLIAWMLALGVFFGAILSLSRPINLVWLIPVLILWYLVWKTYRSVHPSRLLTLGSQTPAVLNLPYEKVEFLSRDGLRLFGWYVHRPDSPTVILVHGLGGSANAMTYHAGVLLKKGYSSLAIDLRAHGRSQGNTCTYGIAEANDVLGALDYLHSRPDVDPKRIGALGISLGAQAVLRAALLSSSIRGVVLEGIGTTMLSDHGHPEPVWLWKLLYPYNWLIYRLGDWMCGVTPEEDTRTALTRLKQSKLLISTGKGTEQRFSRILYQLASEPKEIYEIPRAQHAAGYLFAPKEYTEKVVKYFDQVLVIHPPQEPEVQPSLSTS
jgi:pimeloyl-ACP methyl ester carboxylesterase